MIKSVSVGVVSDLRSGDCFFVFILVINYLVLKTVDIGVVKRNDYMLKIHLFNIVFYLKQLP